MRFENCGCGKNASCFEINCLKLNFAKKILNFGYQIWKRLETVDNPINFEWPAKEPLIESTSSILLPALHCTEEGGVAQVWFRSETDLLRSPSELFDSKAKKKRVLTPYSKTPQRLRGRASQFTFFGFSHFFAKFLAHNFATERRSPKSSTAR